MPPKSKKKKKPANPARGFATKSTPSKIKDTETTDDNESINKTNEEENLPMVVESVNDQEAIEEEDKEDKFLISLIDKLKHIDEKKVDRYFKELSSLSSIELNNFDDWPILSLDSNIEHKIIEHLQKVENHEDYVNTNDVEIRSTKDYERMISELDIVYMTLLRLGFKQIDIEKCIKTLGKRTKLILIRFGMDKPLDELVEHLERILASQTDGTKFMFRKMIQDPVQYLTSIQA
ncbi:23255_t:CDS:2 [Entrophospora sp. SA101]|nr:23255_t:CDS:2 [Entrophospora sp. SA101]CAJ0836276.1 17624_t:CDS:2 [Entrophospora sp. SA101]